MNLRACLLAVCLSTSLVAASSTRGDELRAAYDADTATYRKQLDELAATCRAQKLDALAEQIAGWLPERDPLRQYFFLIRSELSPQTASPDEQVAAAKSFLALRQARGERLFALAKQASAAGSITTAVEWTYEALREDSALAPARKLLGYREVDGRWLTPFEAAKVRGGAVWHPQFGWLPQTQISRYEAGERYLNGRWISAADDAKFHATIERGWIVDTEHFRIRTTHSLAAGARLGAQLESLYQVWRQMFARYQTPDAEWQRLFAGGEPRELPAKRYPVVYFRTKDEYVAALKKREPRIELTSGIFMNDDDTAYFYADEKANNDAFLYHEVVHELFMLTRPTTLKVGAKGNFWIVEGIACYFESLHLHADYAELGDVRNARLHAARYRRLVDDFYVPLAELTSFSLQRLQQDERIARLYSQSSGLAWFLQHADAGRHREATVDYLTAVYAGKDSPTTLAERTGIGYPDLDRRYREYLERLPDTSPLPAAPQPPPTAP